MDSSDAWDRRQGIPWSNCNVSQRREILRVSTRCAIHGSASTMSRVADRARDGQRARARRRLQGDHRAAPAGRPALVRRDRQGRRALRGRRAPAGPAAARQRRDAGRRGHRPARARLRAPGDDRHPRRGRRSSRSPTRSPRSTRSTTWSSPPAPTTCWSRWSARATTTCSSCSPSKIRTIDDVLSHRDVHVPQAAQADLLLGRALSPAVRRAVAVARDRRRRLGPRPSLPGDTDADVAIVGAGFTGLWTAYYLPRPTRRCGSWCSRPRSPGSARPAATAAGARRCSRPRSDRVAGLRGRTRDGALAQHEAMRATVDEVVRVAAAEGIDAHVAQGRHRQRSPAPRPAAPGPRRGRRRPRLGTRRGRPAAARRGRGGRRAAARPDAVGATYTPDCARDPPGPAGARPGRAPSSGAASRIHEQTPVDRDRAGPGGHRPHGTVRAEVVVRATEGYTADPRRAAARGRAGLLADRRHRAAADADAGTQIGLRRRETFTDHRHLIIYGQRTADGRLVFGGRGAPYHFGSRDRGPASTASRGSSPAARRPWSTCSPVLRGARFTHAWGGALGIAARLVRLGRARPADRAGLGRRLRRRRRRYDEPGRPDAARPGAAPRHRPDPAALGRPPLAPLGARAAALAGRQRRPAGRDRRRRRGAPHPAPEPHLPRHGPPHRPLTPLPAEVSLVAREE